jgi:hypothetical protein
VLCSLGSTTTPNLPFKFLSVCSTGPPEDAGCHNLPRAHLEPSHCPNSHWFVPEQRPWLLGPVSASARWQSTNWGGRRFKNSYLTRLNTCDGQTIHGKSEYGAAMMPA